MGRTDKGRDGKRALHQLRGFFDFSFVQEHQGGLERIAHFHVIVHCLPSDLLLLDRYRGVVFLARLGIDEPARRLRHNQRELKNRPAGRL
jgi:hypothetical protein